MTDEFVSDFDRIFTSLEAQELLRTPLLNKGTGFSYLERSELKLHGLLPSHISSIEEQSLRRYKNFNDKRSDIEKYLYLTALQDRNEVLFYKFVLEHVEEMLPYIYTPTVGDASLDFSNIYSQNRGIYISYTLKDKMTEMIANIPKDNIDVIVVTDGSRILGLGDMGIGGMAIPVGKLSLYTIFGGIHPNRTLPVLLDLGTNNPNLLKDPLYLGWKHERIQGKDYDEFIDLFVSEIKNRYPNVLLQWEDFSKPNAGNLLKRYRNKLCSFNDDIQGTASVALAAILSALKVKESNIKNEKIMIVGGGGAGLGIANIITKYLTFIGLSTEEALENIFIVDREGLLLKNQSFVEEDQKPFAKDATLYNLEPDTKLSLEHAISLVKPSVLIGVSGVQGLFTKKVVETMSKQTIKPIIFPLSNPTSQAEAQPEDIVQWSKGEAIIATGSPPKTINFNNKTISIAQCNNVYIFPGVGLGVIASKASKVTDEMFLKAAEILSEESAHLKTNNFSIFPELSNLREVSKKIAIEIAKYAMDNNLSNVDNNPETLVANVHWSPNYPEIKRSDNS